MFMPNLVLYTVQLAAGIFIANFSGDEASATVTCPTGCSSK